jgi:hypothetical protein
MKLLKKILIGLALVIVALAGFVTWQMGGPRNVLGMIRYDQRQEGKLRVGDPAPDAEFVAIDGFRRVRLKEFIGGKPLVLVFGSFT